MDKTKRKTVKKKIEEKPKVKRKRRKKKKKGFTLIELLAVIVILGLLMAIAIPSVTKYITQSRKKTVTTTVGNYIGALVNEVNDLQYTFTSYNTVYAVPIECISLERGGTDPFGEWHQANDSYWAYVLIQYDDENSKYIYGFTFKDSAGYGLYPTAQSNIKESGSQIKTGYDLNRPTNGTVENITSLANWDMKGFEVDSTTKLVVLEAESDGVMGDGKTTCTLCQKGNNYAQVEEEKMKKAEEEKANAPAYAIYSEDDQSLTFIRSLKAPVVGQKYNNKTITYVYTGFETEIYEVADSANTPWTYHTSNIKSIIFADVIKPISTKAWFADLSYCEYIDLSKLDTSKVTDMTDMFYNTGHAVSGSTFKVVGLDTLDVSNVEKMNYMFYGTAGRASSWDIGDISGWETTSLVSMYSMFEGMARNSTQPFIMDLSKWDVSNVTNMSAAFSGAGYTATSWSLGDISKWDVSNVTNMYGMFQYAGYNASYGLNLKNWNVENVNYNTNFNKGVTDKIKAPTWVN